MSNKIIEDDLFIDRERVYYYDFSKITFPIQDWHVINARADAIRKEKGYIPMFEFGAEYDENGWYDFDIECKLADADVTDIELWFRVENGSGDDNQQSYKIDISDNEINEIHNWLIGNEETRAYIKECAELEETV